jgi:hypothetical protein
MILKKGEQGDHACCCRNGKDGTAGIFKLFLVETGTGISALGMTV